jgi:hypothetical protein
MPHRLDWDKARRRQVVAQRGSDPAEVTRFRAVAASDADVDRLRKLGYTGKRPATTADLRQLIKSWAPTELGVSRQEIDAVRSARGSAQRLAAAALAEKLDIGYRTRLIEIDSSISKMKPATPGRLRRQATIAYQPLADELRALAKGTCVAARQTSAEPKPGIEPRTQLTVSDAELAVLRALPAGLRQQRAEILWSRISERYESKRDSAMTSRSTSNRQARLRVLFMEYERARRALFDDNGLTPPG